MFTNLSYANLPYWGILPMGVTNYGRDTQVFTIPEYASGQIGMTLNPIAQFQFGTAGLQMPSPFGFNPMFGCGMMFPFYA